MKLSVNLNKVALLRNSRGTGNPSLRVAAESCIAAGAPSLTLHWREDNRHATRSDVVELARLANEHKIEFNLEGDTRSELLQLAYEIRPTQLTLVPVTPGEITSDHGWRLPEKVAELKPIVAVAKSQGIRTSIFIDANTESAKHAVSTGTERVEIYTEPYARAFGTSAQASSLRAVGDCARAARQAGLGVNAGHDLDLRNLPLLVEKVPEIEEVSIGHALLCDALYLGLVPTIKAYLGATRGRPLAGPLPRTCTRHELKIG